MKLGFVGVGAIASAIVTGLAPDGADALRVTLSPRGATTAAALAARFAGVEIAASNQAVLDASDMVLLAVRSQIAAELLPTLRFRPDHRVVSLIATLPLPALQSLVAPAAQVTRAIPLPAVAFRQGATVIFPADTVVAGLFGTLGTAFEVDSREAFDAFIAATGTLASYFAVADTVASWLARKGISEPKARQFVASLYEGLSGTISQSAGASFSALAEECATPGGLNEQVAADLERRGMFGAILDSLDAVHTRIVESGTSS